MKYFNPFAPNLDGSSPLASNSYSSSCLKKISSQSSEDIEISIIINFFQIKIMFNLLSFFKNLIKNWKSSFIKRPTHPQQKMLGDKKILTKQIDTKVLISLVFAHKVPIGSFGKARNVSRSEFTTFVSKHQNIVYKKHPVATLPKILLSYAKTLS